jgi:hypothetical protein
MLAATAVVAIVAFSVSGCGSTSATPSIEQMAPASIAKMAMHNALAAGWVHEVVRANDQGQSLSMVNDIGSSDGRQVVDADGAKATVIVIGPAAYIQGDTNAVSDYFGLSTGDPQQVAGKWLSLDASDPNYSAVTASVTLKSDFSNFIVGPFTKGQVTTVAGQQAVPLFGHSPAQAGSPSVPTTLYVTTTGKVLPVAYRSSYQGMTETVKWSAWGRTVSLAAPPNPIPEPSVTSEPTSPSGPSNV